MDSAYAQACSKGYPYLDTRGGAAINGIWFTRYCDTEERTNGIMVGWDGTNKHWVFLNDRGRED